MRVVRLWVIMYRGTDAKYYAYAPDLEVAHEVSLQILHSAFNDKEHAPRGLYSIFQKDILTGRTILPVDGNMAKIKFAQYARVQGLDPDQVYLCLSRIEFMINPSSDKKGEKNEKTDMETSS